MSLVTAVAVPVIVDIVKSVIARGGSTTTAIKEVENRVKHDPVLQNELNAEPAYQSRVVIGSIVSALGVVVPVIARLFGFDVDGNYIVEFGSALITLWGAGYALYGRLRNGLKPLFNRG